MYTNNVVPSIYKFHSITNLYKGLPEADLSLEIYEYGIDAVEIKLRNKKYKSQLIALKKQFICFNLCFVIYITLLLFKTINFLNIGIFLILWLMVFLWRVTHLIESENLILCHDFGIHLQIKKFLGNHNRYIAASSVNDVVINEVLEDLDFRYLIILRTKGILFNKKPIICIFNVFKPSYDCLSLVYKHLNKVIIHKK